MEERKITLHPQEQPSQALGREPSEEHQHLMLKLPWWRSSFVGYLVSPFLTGIALFIAFLDRLFTLEPHLTGGWFFLVTVVVAWLWGVGPALVAIILGVVALAAFIIPPEGFLSFRGWGDVATYFSFLLAELIVALITAQREKSQQRVRVAEQEAQARAQELAEANQALAQSNQQLESANKLKDTFLSRASHELKTPITTIRGQAQLALRRAAKAQQTAPEGLSLHPYLEKIDAQTHRLHTLIEDLLDMSSLSSGKIPLRYAACDLGSLCREIVDDQHVLSDRHISLELPTDPVIIRADSQRLTQVIINLVSNAVKYSPPHMVIDVRVSQEISHVLLTVHNDYPSIPQEQCLHLFEAFYRASEAQHSSIRGWGLGLAISKEIIERHTGQIWVESSQANGTTFFVRLPRQAVSL